MDKALELAETIASKAQVAIRQSKRCIRRGMQTDMYTGTAYEAEAFGVCCATEDLEGRNEGIYGKNAGQLHLFE